MAPLHLGFGVECPVLWGDLRRRASSLDSCGPASCRYPRGEDPPESLQALGPVLVRLASCSPFRIGVLVLDFTPSVLSGQPARSRLDSLLHSRCCSGCVFERVHRLRSLCDPFDLLQVEPALGTDAVQKGETCRAISPVVNASECQSHCRLLLSVRLGLACVTTLPAGPRPLRQPRDLSAGSSGVRRASSRCFRRRVPARRRSRRRPRPRPRGHG